jgi:phospholipid/cholesterol/gamma-HCH transport system substrate-binding protein
VKRTGHIPFMRLKIGIFVVIAILLLLWATFQSGSFRLGKEDEVTVHFPRVGGLEEGAAVRLNGVPVGVVRDITLSPQTNDVAVKLGVKRGTRARLHQGASARITTVGFLAELYVELSSGDESRPPIQSDSEIETGLLADPAQLMNKVGSMEDSLNQLLSSLNVTGRGLASGRGTLGRLTQDERLYEQLVALTNQATRLTLELSRNQARVSERLVSVTTSLDSLATQMQHGNGTVAQLMRSDEVYNRLASATARMDSILAKVQTGQGNVGRFVADSTLYEDTKALVGSMKRLMAEIEKNPKKYFKFSIF